MHPVTTYLIEVQAASKQYDVQAQKLAREMLLLPKGIPHDKSGHHDKSGGYSATTITSTTPLTIHTSQLYYLIGNLTSTQIDQLVKQLLVDPVVQNATV